MSSGFSDGGDFDVSVVGSVCWRLSFEFFCAKAIAAIHRTIAFRLEWHSCGGSAFCAINFSSARGVFPVALDPHQDAAIWAPFGLINESLGAEKFLFAR